MSVENIKFNIEKKILILVLVVLFSIIYALIKMKASEIIITNRKSKAENLKSLFKEIKLVDWGESAQF